MRIYKQCQKCIMVFETIIHSLLLYSYKKCCRFPKFAIMKYVYFWDKKFIMLNINYLKLYYAYSVASKIYTSQCLKSKNSIAVLYNTGF